MPNRGKSAANAAVFRLLDEFCSSRDEPLANAGSPRWISTTNGGREFLVRARLTEQISFSASTKVARFDLSNRAYFISSGLDAPEPPKELTTEELDGGILTAFLAELAPRPLVPPLAIRDVVEFADKLSTPDYDGHDPSLMRDLFPKIQVFSAENLLPEETFKVFFLICLSDRRRIEQWIDQQLADTLMAMTELSASSVPYEALCRALLDMDPTALFLTLYRCLESLYAYAQAKAFIAAIGAEKNWLEMAEKLEITLGWYPREEPSLESLLGRALPEDLHGVAAALKEPIPRGATESSFVAKKIYQLRNAIVHYRPLHHKVSIKRVDWNRLCEATTRLVRHIHKECSV